MYANIIEDQIRDGIVEECKDKSVNSGYFMPHTAVLRPDKETSRVRIVFDASSKDIGLKSLNDMLLSGPNLNPNILDVILNFRKHEIAFSGDIEKAFLMIDIDENERKCLKFIWIDYDNCEGFKIMNMKRLPFGVTTSPFILKAIIKYHIKKYANDKPDCVKMLNSSLHVDDLYWGTDTVNDAYRLSSDAVNILQSASMNLRRCNSNSNELKKLWNQNGIAINDSIAHAKVLGLRWDTENDVLLIE
ncbi:uncharacterized protein [Parasteatoda tepidariorum]|uniref:uncharacterized protein n=1 Tax=Parasteatoda tepidariorum TaxID=114398 RepID=UPI001C7246A9|nr:uncharacterized protein LOC122272163 [Parasteatoda tepidariorum]